MIIWFYIFIIVYSALQIYKSIIFTLYIII